MSWTECRSGFADPERCKAWCLQNPGWCDEGARRFCAAAPDDPFCACERAPRDTNPGCFDRACIERGYRSAESYRPDCTLRCAGAEKAGGTDPEAFRRHCGRDLERFGPPGLSGLSCLGPRVVVLALALVVLGLALAARLARARALGDARGLQERASDGGPAAGAAPGYSLVQ